MYMAGGATPPLQPRIVAAAFQAATAVPLLIRIKQEGNNAMHIRRFQESDAPEVSALIVRTLRVSNTRDYPPEQMEAAQRPSQRGLRLMERA